MRHRLSLIVLAIGMATLLVTLACSATQKVRTSRRTPTDTGTGSLEATRRALEGSWGLVSLEVVDAQGARRQIKASGRLQYDAFGTMTVRGVIEDPKLRDTLVIDYTGRIVIDTVKHEFYPADLASDRPADPTQIVPISPDKVRQYELSGDTFTVTYLDSGSRPTAVLRWLRGAS